MFPDEFNYWYYRLDIIIHKGFHIGGQVGKFSPLSFLIYFSNILPEILKYKNACIIPLL